ncbi:hypothetical protein GJ744_008060 [Endocarpon pusillum]|uniref:Uncharacterized protein n=1 Tax=Endocarpon pusillum TaxID=364733 RepID=A0A8H7E4R4_9EURO|nr:hypothetical protein GJ744_008060 [Endocarpon pusillum]
MAGHCSAARHERGAIMVIREDRQEENAASLHCSKDDVASGYAARFIDDETAEDFSIMNEHFTRIWESKLYESRVKMREKQKGGTLPKDGNIASIT